MANGIVSRWPVVISVPVLPEDVDADGLMTDGGSGRIFAVARDAYFAKCRTVDASRLEVRSTSMQAGVPVSPKGDVTVSVNVVEVYPETFTMTALVRRGDDGEKAATAWCSLSPGGRCPSRCGTSSSPWPTVRRERTER
jgi:acyl-CoA thioesterase FadM